MHQQISFQQDFSAVIKARQYQCPCGKTYLSYPALFTHVKQKHAGNPPGKVIKPPTLYDRRGRPRIKGPKITNTLQRQVDQNIQSDINPQPAQTEQQRIARLTRAEVAISNCVKILQQMPQQQLNKTHLNEIQVFCEISVYLTMRRAISVASQGTICVADGFLQFAQSVCYRITWSHFESFYLLFMLFIQFIIDSQNDKNVLRYSNMDIFCEYINDFIENHIRDMAEYYGLENIWIMQENNSVRVLYEFFDWCQAMRYITYNVSLAKGRKGKAQNLYNKNGLEQLDNNSQINCE